MLLACCIIVTPTAYGQDDFTDLRRALEQMRADYEARISALERRLEAAEEKSAQPAVSAVESVDANASAGSNAFNPAMSVIFLGQA